MTTQRGSLAPNTGLRRFVGSQTGPAPVREPSPERCEMCDAPVEARHGHVVDREGHHLVCACRACYLLFTREQTTGRYRAVPERYLRDPERRLTQADWERLQVPVGMAFFLSSAERAVTAFYPSPAGPTECLLNLDAWSDLTDLYPLLAAAEPEVEAILIRRSDNGIDAYLVPIDVCYELVGAMRLHWRGFDGGVEAKALITEFFTEVERCARPLKVGS